MSRPLRRRLLLLLLLLMLASLGGAWYRLPQLLSGIIGTELTRLGLVAEVLELERPRFRSARISRLVVRDPTTGWVLELHDIALDYRWRRLVAGQIDSVQIGGGRLSLAAPPGGAQTSAALPLPPLPSQWLPGVPFADLLLQPLTVEVARAEGPPLLLLLAGRIEVHHGANAKLDMSVALHDQPLWRLKGTADEVGDRLWLSLASTGAELALQGRLSAADGLTASGQVQLDLASLQPWLALSEVAGISLPAGSLNSQWQVGITPDRLHLALLPGAELRLAAPVLGPLRATALVATLRDGGQLQWTTSDPLELTVAGLELHGEGLELQAEAAVALRGQALSLSVPDPLHYTYTPEAGGALTAGGWELHGRGLVLPAKVAAESLQADALDLSMTAPLQITMAPTAGRWSSGGGRLTLTSGQGRGVLLPEAALDMASPLSLSWGEQWQLEAALESKVQLPQGGELAGVALAPLQGELRLSQLQGEGEGIRLKGRVVAQEVAVDLAAGRSRPLRIETGIALSGDKLILDPVVTAPGSALRLKGQLEQGLAAGSGSGRLTLASLPLSELGDLMQPFHLPTALALTAGRVTGGARLRWGAAPRLDLDLQIDEGAARWGEGEQPSRIEGVTLAPQLRLESAAWRTRSPVTVTARQLDVGLPITAIELTATAQGGWDGMPQLSVARSTAQLLGGTVSTEAFDYQPQRPRNPLAVVMEGIDLAELLALEQQQGVSGSGTLDGRLPMWVGSEGVAVAEGVVAARREGGVIRYQPNEAALSLAASNPGIDFALRALADYRYEYLRSLIDYHPDGRLLLGLYIRGRNPEAAPQPIELNVNLEENVPALLRSLRIGDDLGREIDRRVQERMRR